VTAEVEDCFWVRFWGNKVRVSVHQGSAAVDPVLLCMGFGGWLELWAPLRRQLHASGLTTVAFDAPGTGASRTSPIPLPLAGHALVAMGLLDRLGVPQASVLGLSWGGLLAQQLAITAPRRITRAVLASTNFGIGSAPPWWVGAHATLHEGPGDALGGAPGPSSRMRLEHYVIQAASVTGWSSLPWLPLLRQQTLVLNGDRDGVTPLVNARLMAKAIPHARLVIVPGGGHTVLLERSDEVGPIIAGFLTE
jgi:poly(3-hydroxyoctanoate) depolymerase